MYKLLLVSYIKLIFITFVHFSYAVDKILIVKERKHVKKSLILCGT